MTKSQQYQLHEPIKDLDSYPITSPLGNRIDPISGAKSFHDGIDIGTPEGVECYAMADGYVLYSNYLWEVYPGIKGDLMGEAIIVQIRYDNGLISQHAHLSKSIVNNGDRVLRGELIGYTGSTGYVTGAHLHMQLWESGVISDKNAVDFRDYLGQKLPELPYDFSEAYYLKMNGDVREAVKRGEFSSGSNHWQLFGYNEGRVYRPILPYDFDEAIYLSHNKDVAQAVEEEKFKSGAHHWQVYGWNESRTYSIRTLRPSWGNHLLDIIKNK